jgi:hypothetical protein
MPEMVTFARRNLEAEHGADSGFDAPMILFNDIGVLFQILLPKCWTFCRCSCR